LISGLVYVADFVLRSGTRKKELSMKRLLCLVMMLFVVFAPCAYADSIPLFAQANIPFLVNFGGDNLLTSTFNGPGVSVVAFGGDLVYDWELNSLPGSSLKPVVEIIAFGPAQGSVTLGGQVYPVDGLGEALTPAITALGSFTFPMTSNGTFTVSVPARLSPISGFAGSEFFLQAPPGRLVLTFDFFPSQPGFPASYQFSQGFYTTTPEPGALGLMASGFAGIVGAVLRKRNCQRSAN
jgi:PEP-CTERM motif